MRTLVHYVRERLLDARRRLPSAALVSVFALPACGQAPAGSANATASAESLPSATSRAETPEARRAREAHAALVAAVDGMVANCEVDVEICTVTRCANEEQRAFRAPFEDGSRSRAELLDAWPALLSDKDPARTAVAAYVIGGLLRTLSSDGSRPAVPQETARALVTSLADLPKFHAAQSIVGMTHAAALAGELEALIAAAEAHPHRQALIPMIYGSMLRYARLAGFPALQIAFEKATSARAAAAIMAAPRALVDATASERSTLCKWTQPFMNEPRPSVAHEAANTMVWCDGAFIDALLDHAASEIEAAKMDKNLMTPLQQICPTRPGAPSPGSEAQCDRLFGLLESATRSTKLREEVRIQALMSLRRLRPDQATLKLAREVRNGGGERMRFRADAVIRALQDSGR